MMDLHIVNSAAALCTSISVIRPMAAMLLACLVLQPWPVGWISKALSFRQGLLWAAAAGSSDFAVVLKPILLLVASVY